MRAQVRSAANVVVDAVVGHLRNYAVEHSLDPMVVPDITRTFFVVSGMETQWAGHLDL